MTGDIDMHYFDMVIRLTQTNLPISVSCSYADKWRSETRRRCVQGGIYLRRLQRNRAADDGHGLEEFLKTEIT